MTKLKSFLKNRDYIFKKNKKNHCQIEIHVNLLIDKNKYLS